MSHGSCPPSSPLLKAPEAIPSKPPPLPGALGSRGCAPPVRSAVSGTDHMQGEMLVKWGLLPARGRSTRGGGASTYC